MQLGVKRGAVHCIEWHRAFALTLMCYEVRRAADGRRESAEYGKRPHEVASSYLLLQAFELAGVISRDTLLRLLRARIGLIPLLEPGQQASPWHLQVGLLQQKRCIGSVGRAVSARLFNTLPK